MRMGMPVGMRLTVKAYGVYCFSVVPFLWQLARPPRRLHTLEAWALRGRFAANAPVEKCPTSLGYFWPLPLA